MAVIKITSGTVFLAPGDWPANNIATSIECIGGGGGGLTSSGNGAGGGGGGEYAIKANVTLVNGAALQVGAGGDNALTDATPTWVVTTSTVRANGGISGGHTSNATGGAGGTGGVGDTTFAGGAGGSSNGTNGGAGGGGAGGPGGVGKAGGHGGNFYGGNGGGGAGGNSSTAGGSDTDAGGTGGLAQDSTAGGTGSAAGGASSGNGGNGSHGSGGGGSGALNATGPSGSGGTGGNGVEWTITAGGTAGAGGGGGGTGGRSVGGVDVNSGNAGAGGSFGGGGAGSGQGGAGTHGTGGLGAGGVIIITYTPNPNPVITPIVGALVTVGVAPVRVVGTVRIPVAGALVLAGAQPNPQQFSTVITPVVGSLVLTGIVVGFGFIRAPPAGTLAITGKTPIFPGGTVVAEPVAGALVASGKQAIAIRNNLRFGLAGYWRFSERSASSGASGTRFSQIGIPSQSALNDSANPVGWVADTTQSAFAGAAQFVRANSNSLSKDGSQYVGTGGFFIAAYIYLSSKTGAMYIASKDGLGQRGSDKNEYGFGYDNTSNSLFLYATNAGANFTSVNTGADALPLNTWMTAFAWYDVPNGNLAAGTLNVRVMQGTTIGAVHSVAYPYGITSGGDIFRVGAIGDTAPTSFFDGYMRGLFFGRRTLTDPEQLQLHGTAGNGLDFPFDSVAPGVPSLVGVFTTPGNGGSQLGPGPITVNPTGLVKGDLLVAIPHIRGVGNTHILRVANTGGQRWSDWNQCPDDVGYTPNTVSTRPLWAIFDGNMVGGNPSFSSDVGSEAMSVYLLVWRPADAANYDFWIPCSWPIYASYTAPSSPFRVDIPGVSNDYRSTVTLAVFISPDVNTWNGLTAEWTQAGMTAAGYTNVGTGGFGQSAAFAYILNDLVNSTPGVSMNQATNGGDPGVIWVMSWANIARPVGGVGTGLVPVQTKIALGNAVGQGTVEPLYAFNLAFDNVVATNDALMGSINWETTLNSHLFKITDDRGNIYTPINSKGSSYYTQTIVTFYAPNITNAPTTMYVVLATGNGDPVGLEAVELAGSIILNDHNSANIPAGSGDNTSISPGTITTTKDGAFIFDTARGMGFGADIPFWDFTAWGGIKFDEVGSVLFAAPRASAYLIQPTAGTLNASAIKRLDLESVISVASFINQFAPVDTPITPTAAALTLSGVAPPVVQGSQRTGLVGALSASGVAPTLSSGTALTPVAGTPALSGLAPSLVTPVFLTPTSGLVTLGGQSAILGTTGRITTNTLAVQLTGNAPSIAFTSNVVMTVPVGALVALGLVPVEVRETVLVVGSGALGLAGSTPQVGQSRQALPLAGAAQLDGSAPVLVMSLNTQFTPDTAALVLTGYPAIAEQFDTAIQPGSGSLVLTGYAPEDTDSGAIPTVNVALEPTRRQYVVGDVVDLSAVFRYITGQLFDPQEVTVTIRTPDEVVSTLLIYRQQKGVYYTRFLTTQNGLHQYRFYADTPGVSSVAGEGYFFAYTEF